MATSCCHASPPLLLFILFCFFFIVLLNLPSFLSAYPSINYTTVPRVSTANYTVPVVPASGRNSTTIGYRSWAQGPASGVPERALNWTPELTQNLSIIFIAGQTNEGAEAKTHIEILVGAVGSLLLVVSLVLLLLSYFCFTGKIRTLAFSGKQKTKSRSRDNNNKKDKKLEAFLEKFGSLAPTRYTYLDVVNMTSSFSRKLGEGGYGGVFEGRLDDGRPVAVKVLKAARGSCKEFFNEVVSIGSTYHVNIVGLLGFCLEGSRRALVYEFMPNGSLDKFIHNHNKNHPSAAAALDWRKLLDIATGIARGLEYLHHGCNIGILHFDIKPHNILLDENYAPKISDFGLAKICRSAEGVISMLGERGTAGYIAPEVFSRSYGAVSSKSDVYSYGMVVLEMAGGWRNVEPRVENTSELYFPYWIYRHVESSDDGARLLRAATAGEEEIARRMVLVGLWCIQTRPADRPSMSRVVDMLEGRISNLEMPPMPVLSSPSSSLRESLSQQSGEIGSVLTLRHPVRTPAAAAPETIYQLLRSQFIPKNFGRK